MNKWITYLIIAALLALALVLLARNPFYLHAGNDAAYSEFVQASQPEKVPAETAAVHSKSLVGDPGAGIQPENEVAYSAFVADIEQDAVRGVAVPAAFKLRDWAYRGRGTSVPA